MFSRPVRSGWNPAPTDIRGATLPETVTSPWLGYVTDAISLSTVVLPAPFGPNSPTHSPFLMEILILFNAQNSPSESFSLSSLLKISVISSLRDLWNRSLVEYFFHTSLNIMIPSDDICEVPLGFYEKPVTEIIEYRHYHAHEYKLPQYHSPPLDEAPPHVLDDKRHGVQEQYELEIKAQVVDRIQYGRSEEQELYQEPRRQLYVPVINIKARKKKAHRNREHEQEHQEGQHP